MATILVIDDEAGMRRLVARILAGAGHRVVEAEDGFIAVDKFRRETPDIIVVDILMPDRDGIETIQKIRAIRGDVGIIAISGGGVVEPSFYLDLAEKFGAHRHLAKPFKSKELIEAVESLCF
jgi:CheY-like chemotaxis protein